MLRLCIITVVVFWAITTLPTIPTYSLNFIKDRCIRDDEKCSSKFENHITKNVHRNLFSHSQSNEKTLKVIRRDPCILTKIASHFNIQNLEMIVSRELTDFEKSLNKCDELINGDTSISVSQIQGDENDINDLRDNLMQILPRSTRCVIVLCKSVCINLVLHLGYVLGFASSIYVWITTEPPALSTEIDYPKKWISLKLMSTELANVNVSTRSTMVSQNHNLDLRSKPKHFSCYEISLLSSEKDRLLLKCNRENTLGTDFFLSPSNDININQGSHLKNFPSKFLKFFKKETLKVVFLPYDPTLQRLDFLDYKSRQCRQGLLCWLYPMGNRSYAREPNCCLGMVIDVLLLLNEDLDIKFHLYEIEDGNYGAMVNGSWNGLIGDVTNKKADIAADYITISEARLESIDFTEPFLIAKMIVASKLQISHLQFINFEVFGSIRPLFWVLIFAFTFVTSIMIYLSERLTCSGSQNESWMLVFIYSVGLLVQRDVGGSIPRLLGSRTVAIVLAVTMMIIMTTYVALLATRNITNKKSVPVSGLNDPKLQYPTPSFKIGTWKDSHYSQMFERSENPKLRRLGESMKPYNFKTFSDLSEQLKTESLHAAIIDTISLDILWNKYDSCNIQFQKSIGHDATAFVLKKGSPWNEPISSFIRMYRDSGQLAAIEKKWFASRCQSQTIDIPKSFGLRYLSGACVMIVFGIPLSVCVLALENAWFERNKSRTSPTLRRDIGDLCESNA